MRRSRRSGFRPRYRRKARRGGFFSKAGKAIALAGTALSVAKGVKDLMNVEYKSHTRAVGSFAITSSGSIHCYSLIGEGDDDGQRNGRSIKATQWDWRGTLYRNALGSDVQLVRLVLVMDKHGAGVTPATTDVLSAISIQSFRNLDNTDRFKILWDKTFILTAGVRECINIKKHFRLNNHIKFTSTGTGISDTDANAIWGFIFSDHASNAPYGEINAKLRYIDN